MDTLLMDSFCAGSKLLWEYKVNFSLKIVEKKTVRNVADSFSNLICHFYIK